MFQNACLRTFTQLNDQNMIAAVLLFNVKLNVLQTLGVAAGLGLAAGLAGLLSVA